MLKQTVALSLLLGTCLPALVQAQSVAPGVIDRAEPERMIPRDFAPDPIPEQAERDKPELEQVTNPDEVLATITQVNFIGATKVPEALLQTIAEPFLDKPITKQDLAELKYKIAQEYYRRGYTLVKAVTPQQDLSDNVLDVRIVEAQVGQVRIKQNDVLYDYVANAMLGSVDEGQVFNETDAETLVSDINDLGDVRATLNLAPGEQFATTDIDVFIEEADDDVNYLTIDNYGAERTGRHVGQLHLEESNLLRWGETIYGDARVSDDDLWSLGGGIIIPTGLHNVLFHTSYYYTDTDIGDDLEFAGIEGESETFDASLSSALINTRDRKVQVRSGLEARRHESTVFGATQWEDDVRRLYGEVSYLERGTSTIWYSAVRVSRGVDIFGASEQNNIAQPSSSARSRLRGEHDSWIVRPTALVNHRPQNIPFFRDGTFKLFATAQLASDVVYSSDQFILGGYGSVRGFEPALSVGDGGYSATVEYQHDIPAHPAVTLLAGPWFDVGTVYNRVEGPANGVIDKTLYSAGIGIEAIADVIPLGDTTLRLDWAHPLGDYDEPSVDDNFFYFRLSQFF